MNGDQPITRRDLEELRRFIEEGFHQINERFVQQEERLMEFSRQIETNLLAAFHSYARGQQTRFHTIETIDNELRLRMTFLEDRILALETRHPLPPTPFPPPTR